MKRLGVCSLLALLALPAMALEPYLVKDVNPVPGAAGSNPSDLLAFGGAVLFRADGGDGSDLWRSNGTAAGTFPLTETGNSKFPPVSFLVTERLFFFLSGGGRGGQDLWVSDGTPAGTVLLAEVEVVPTSPVWSARQGVLYFAARNLEHGDELWRSDGTPAGTHMVADIRPGMGGSNLRGLTEYRGRIWFGADDGQRGGALWSTDGTAAGTRLEVDPVPSSAAHGSPDRIQVVGRRLAFFAQSPGPGRSRQLWAGDGTARGTRPITNLTAALHDSVVHGNRLYFVAEHRRVQELWVSDGTARGTRVLAGFRNGSFSLPRQQGLPGLFLFAANDGAHGVEPWVTDGTPRGTRLLRDICPGDCSSLPGPGRTFAGRLWFAAEEGAHGRELWSTDGTAAGTRLVRDLCPGDCGSRPQAFTVVGGRLLFVAGDGEAGQELWSTDGTGEGTVRVSDFEHQTLSEETLEGSPLGAVLDGQLLFAASDFLHGHELWSTDGTPPNTRLVEDINRTDFGGSFPAGLRPLGDGVVFTVRSLGIPELWKSDGTEAGTARLATFGPDEQAGALPEGAFAEAGADEGGGLLFYFGHSPVWSRTEPWRTDGTAAGTFRLTDASVPGCCAGQEMRALGGTVFFDLWDAEHGRELWASDGTREGTRLVRDILPDSLPDSAGSNTSTGSDPRELTVFQGRLWFAAEGPFTGRELWTSDGTAAGTALFKDIDPEGHAGSAPTFLTVHAGRLWFFADDGENGRELWSSDGTEAGTRLAVEFEPGPGFLEVQLMASLGDRLVLSARDQGLWATDGTPAGTRKIHDREHDAFGHRGVWTVFQGRLYYVVDGSLWSTDGTEAGPLLDRDGEPIYLPRSFAVLGGRLVFSADDGLGRLVLWESDGTPAGTFPAEPRIVVDHPWELVRAGDRVFFPGDDRFHGTELWAVRP